MMIQNGDHLQHEIDNAGVPPEQRSDWPLPSFDGLDWAKAFNAKHPSVSVVDALAWFAPALMRGFDEHAGRPRQMDPYERAVRWAEEWQKSEDTRKFLVDIIKRAEELGGFDHETKWRPVDGSAHVVGGCSACAVVFSDEAIRMMTLAAGGEFHGPRVEHVSMEEQAFFVFVRALIASRGLLSTSGSAAAGPEAAPGDGVCPGHTPALEAYDEAMRVAGVPHEPIQVYDSNSWRRVGLKRAYREVMAPTYNPRDGHPDIRGTDTLHALVAAFNAMLEIRGVAK